MSGGFPMHLAYDIKIEPDDNGTYLVTCPDLPEVTTFGESEADVLKRAHAAIEEALAARIADGLEIPLPRKNTSRAFRLPSSSFLKVLLYLEAKHAGISRAEIARRLGWHRNSVDRLFQLDHASKLDQIEKAFGAINRTLELEIEDAR
jgi:antitoxin HicB